MDYDFSPLEQKISWLNKLDAFDISDSLSPTLKLVTQHMEQYSKMIRESTAIKVALASFADVLSDYYKDCFISSDATATMLSHFSKIIEKNSSAIDFENLKDAMIKSISTAAKSTQELGVSNDNDDEDYITADETPIKEWNIPDTVAIPVANHRIRMRTDIFISILSGIIVPVLLWIAGQIVDLHEAYINAKTESQRIELEQERNDLIRENNRLLSQYIDLLNSTDTSNSSESDQIESWKEGLPEVVSDPSASGSAPDLTQGSQNNNPE